MQRRRRTLFSNGHTRATLIIAPIALVCISSVVAMLALAHAGTGTITVDGKQVVQGHIEHTIRARFSLDEMMDCGEGTGTPATADYAAEMPFKFTGTLNKFVIHLAEFDADDQQELRETARNAAIRQ